MGEPRRVALPFPAPLIDVRVRSVAPPRRAAAPEPAKREAEPAPSAAAEAKLASAAAALASAATELARRAERMERESEPRMLALVKAIAAEVIRAEVKARGYDLTAIVRQALALARGVERGAVVLLHPDDHAAARSSALVAQIESPAVTLRADASVSLGSCRVETPFGTVTRDLSEAIADVLAAVDGRR